MYRPHTGTSLQAVAQAADVHSFRSYVTAAAMLRYLGDILIWVAYAVQSQDFRLSSMQLRRSRDFCQSCRKYAIRRLGTP